MNLEQLRKRTRAASGFNMVSLYDDTAMNLILNEVHRDICGAEDWSFLYAEDDVTLDAATTTLKFPMRTLSSVVLTDKGDRLHATTVDEIDILPPGREDKPEAYAHTDERTLHFWPTPDQAYTARIRGYRSPHQMDQDSDAPEFESEFQPAIIYEAAARLLIEFGDFDRVEGLRGQAQDALSRMRVRYLGSKDRALIQMGGRVHDHGRWRL